MDERDRTIDPFPTIHVRVHGLRPIHDLDPLHRGFRLGPHRSLDTRHGDDRIPDSRESRNRSLRPFLAPDSWALFHHILA
jgi:hypothetical protein